MVANPYIAPTTQLQCDEGATPTPGFSVGPDGSLLYKGEKQFVACETGQNGGLNLYTTSSEDQTGCKDIELVADSCHNTPSSPSGPGESYPVPPGGGDSTSAPSGGDSTSVPSGGESSTIDQPPTYGSTSAPSEGGSSSVPLPPGYTTSTVSETQIVTVPCDTTDVPSYTEAPSGWSTAVQPPGGESSYVPPGGESTIVQPPPPEQTPEPIPSGGESTYLPPGGGETPTAPAGGETTYPPGGESTYPSGGESTYVPPGGGETTTAPPGGETTYPSGGESTYPSGGDSTDVPPGGRETATAPPPSYPTATKPEGSCSTDLSGDYEYPHLIIPVDSSKPDHAAGTSYNGTVSSTESTIFNFDIPAGDAGKTCSLVFLFPKLEDLETSSYSFSGDGKLDFCSLENPATESTNYNNVPKEKEDFGEHTVSPGNSYVIKTFDCPAGETVGYKIGNAGSTELEFFEDYNPSP